MAAYRHYDVLLVNAMFDGMNLVAKEGPLVNEREGVSILSENTGAHEELGEYALSVNPFDIQELADSIYAALTMAPAERRRRARGLAEIVTSRDPGRLDRRAARRHPRQGPREAPATAGLGPLRCGAPDRAVHGRRATSRRYDAARAHIRSRAAARHRGGGAAAREDPRRRRARRSRHRASCCATTRGASGRWPTRSTTSYGRVPPAAVPRRHARAAERPEHTLSITDGVMRFRIIKLEAGHAGAPDMRVASRRRGGPRGGAEGERPRRASARGRDGRRRRS